MARRKSDKVSLTVDEDKLIELDGVDYEMVHPDNMRPSQYLRLQKLQDRMTALTELDDPTEEDYDETDATVGKMVRIVIPEIPVDIANKTGAVQFQKIMAHLNGQTLEEFQAEVTGTLPVDTTISSPASNASTEVTPING